MVLGVAIAFFLITISLMATASLPIFVDVSAVIDPMWFFSMGIATFLVYALSSFAAGIAEDKRIRELAKNKIQAKAR
jgi:hypothetical protein